MNASALLQIRELTKVFDQTVAVDRVSMEILPGEIHGLIGENGSGKSTITSMMAGIQKPTSGEMLLEGKPYRPGNQLEANRCGISIIVQEMCTIEDLSVAENIFFGNEEQFMRFGMVDKKRMCARAGEELAKFGFGSINPAEDVSSYSFEQRKLIELVKAAFFTPKLLVVDETTTALSHEGREQLFRVIKQSKELGTAIVIISHDLPEVLGLCDRITILRDGRHIATIPNRDVSENALKTYMIGRELTGAYYRQDTDSHIAGKVVLKADSLSLAGSLDSVSFELHQGEILGVGGLTESGIHELGKVLFGAVRPDRGGVTLDGDGAPLAGISQAIRKGVAYTSKNRDQEGLVLNASIMDNVCLGNFDQVEYKGVITRRSERRFADAEVERLQIKMENALQFVSHLSGGNKQKVVLAKWLARGSDILILDSPTRGIDVKVKAAVYQLMQELTARGKSIIMISEELVELIGMCDRLLILRKGAISGELLRSDGLNEEKIINLMI